jgi:hypothetical protein
MPIFHGDFFDDKAEPIAFHKGNAGKMPFEDRVREYIAAHPDDTVEGCAKALGICVAAVEIACANLVAKGQAKWSEA